MSAHRTNWDHNRLPPIEPQPQPQPQPRAPLPTLCKRYLVTDPGFGLRYAVSLTTIAAAMTAAQHSVTCTVWITELYGESRL